MTKSPSSLPNDNRIRVRTILIGILLSIAICLLTPFNNAYRNATPLGGSHFPLAPFFILFWLTIAVYLAGKCSTKLRWLTGNELLMIWIMMVLVSGIAYTGLVRTFFINLTAPYHFATIENRWATTLQPLLPKALYPQDRQAVENLYNGLPHGRHLAWTTVVAQIPWRAWLPPLLNWSGFILLCYFVMLCLINLFSRQWIHHERLNLPLLHVPQSMAKAFDQHQLGRFFGHPFLLCGLCIPLFLHTLNGLSFYYPEVPQIPTLALLGQYFPAQGIFSGFQKMKIFIYPAFIGFAFLTSRQLSFSFWVCYLIGGLFFGLLSVAGYDIPSAALGVTFGPTLARPEETQMIGAYGVFFLFILWLARHQFYTVLKEALFLAKPHPAHTEWVQPRLALWGTALGLTAIVIWLHHFGMPFFTAILFLGACFMLMIVATRIICQGGLAYFTLTAAPLDGLLSFFGPRFFTHIGLLLSAVVQKVLFVDLRESLMPSLLHARHLNQKMNSRRVVLTGVVVVLLVGLVASFLAMLALGYKYGLRELQLDWASRTTVNVYKNIQTLIEAPSIPNEWVIIFSIFGAVLMLILVIGYQRFYWWPLHPIGYLMAYSSAMRILWFSFFVGWLLNALCMRYGGIDLFKRLRFFFAGLIIGDFLMGGFWALIGLFSDVIYQVLPT